MPVEIRHDRSALLAQGVFTYYPINRLDAWHLHSDDTVWVNFRGPQTLQPQDLRVLHAVAATGYSQYRAKNGATIVPVGASRPVVSRLELKADRDVQVTEYQTSLRELAEQAGMGTGARNLAATFRSLQRLSEVTVWTYTRAEPNVPQHMTKKVEVEVGGERYALRCTSVESSRLLYAVSLRGGPRERDLNISLNPRETAELLGLGRNFTIISLDEARQLGNAAATLLHARFCAFIDPGKSRTIAMETMLQYVYGDMLDTNHDVRTIRTREQNIRRALEDLNKAGWSIVARANACWKVTRPHLRKEEEA
jgi:hypothetical protein